MKRTFRNLSALLLVLAMLLSQSVTASAATVNIQKKDDFVFSPGSECHAADLFGDDFKNLMPGDTVRQSITIKAEFGLFKEDSIKVSLKGTSIPHETVGNFGTGKVLMLPAPEGTGVIAGGPARAVLELCGVKDIRTKSYGSNNPINMVKATIEGLASLRTAEEVAKMRGKTVEELLG